MRSSLLDFNPPAFRPRARFAAPSARVGISDRGVRMFRSSEEISPALALWQALRDCPDLRCRFSTGVGFLIGGGPLIPAHVCRPGDAAVLAVHTGAWAGVNVASYLGRPALHVLSAEGMMFLRATPGPALSPARWAACLRLAEALPVTLRAEPADPLSPPAPARAAGGRALPLFWRNLANIGLGCVVTLNSAGMRSRFPLRTAHVACDGGRLLVTAQDGFVLHVELGAVAGVRRESDGALVLLDEAGREAMVLRPFADGAWACAKTWAAVSRHHFPRR
jgi:hypothetical protein